MTRGSVTGLRIVTSPLVATGTVGTAFYTTPVLSVTQVVIPFLICPAVLLSLRLMGNGHGWPSLRDSHGTSGTFPVSIVVSYSDDDGNLTDADSDPDQLGSIFPPEDLGDRPQVILDFDNRCVAPTVTTLSASSIGATKASLTEMSPTPVVTPHLFVFITELT